MVRRLGALVDVMRVPASGDPMRAVVDVSRVGDPRDVETEVLVVGGGTGGVAAAWAASRSGRRVCLLEETDWIGGQLTAQGVSALPDPGAGEPMTRAAFARLLDRVVSEKGD